VVTKYFFFEKYYYAIVCINTGGLGKKQSVMRIRGRLTRRKFATQALFLWLSELQLHFQTNSQTIITFWNI
jgi:hypothetical protein